MTRRTAHYDDEDYELVLIDKTARPRFYWAAAQCCVIIILLTLLMGYLEGMFQREELILQCRADTKSPACKVIFDKQKAALSK